MTKKQLKGIEQAYEHGLPEYLQHDLDAFKKGLEGGLNTFGLLLGRALRQHKLMMVQ